MKQMDTVMKDTELRRKSAALEARRRSDVVVELLRAIDAGTTAKVRALLDIGASPTLAAPSSSDCAVHRASSLHDRIDVLRLLLERRADVDLKRSDDGATPLCAAAASGNVPAIEILLVAGASTDARDNEGRSPLHLAVRGLFTDAVARLLDGGADANVKDAQGTTPVGVAITAEDVPLINLLLANSADPVARRDVDGWTQLHAAAASGNMGIIRALFKRTADHVLLTTAPVTVGSTEFPAYSTPSDVARLAGHGEAARLIDEGAVSPPSQRSATPTATPVEGDNCPTVAGAGPAASYRSDTERDERKDSGAPSCEPPASQAAAYDALFKCSASI